jgi:hypothetical protein
MIGTDTNSKSVARTLAGVTSQRRVKAAESDPTSSPGLRRAKFRAVRGLQHSAAQPAALAVAAAVLVFVLSSPEYPRLVVFPLIGLVLSLYPLVCFIQTRQARHIPVFIISTANWLYFVAPFLYSQLPRGDGRRIIPTEYLTELALYPTLSIAAFILAYYFLPSTSKRIFESGLRLSGAKLQMWSIWMCVAGSCYFLVKVLFPAVVEPLGRVLSARGVLLRMWGLVASDHGDYFIHPVSARGVHWSMPVNAGVSETPSNSVEDRPRSVGGISASIRKPRFTPD